MPSTFSFRWICKQTQLYVVGGRESAVVIQKTYPYFGFSKFGIVGAYSLEEEEIRLIVTSTRYVNVLHKFMFTTSTVTSNHGRDTITESCYSKEIAEIPEEKYVILFKERL